MFCLFSFFWHNALSSLPAVSHNELGVLSLPGLFHASTLVPLKTFSIYIGTHEGSVIKSELCKHTKEKSKGLTRLLFVSDDSPSTGRMHEESDQGGGGRTHTVESQHGVFELLLTYNMIWKGANEAVMWCHHVVVAAKPKDATRLCEGEL